MKINDQKIHSIDMMIRGYNGDIIGQMLVKIPEHSLDLTISQKFIDNYHTNQKLENIKHYEEKIRELKNEQ